MAKQKTAIAMLTVTVVVVLAFVTGGCPKSPDTVGHPAKTSESAGLPANAPNFAIDPQFDEAGDFSEGIAEVTYKEPGTPGPYYTERNVYKYIDKKGAYITKPETEVTPAGDSSEDLAVVPVG